jgi:small subunit ribosomal protein S16
MLMIRLQRVGRKHEPVFRLVLTDSKNGPKSGKFLEILGNFDARSGEKAEFKVDRVKYWMEKGAKLSDTVHNLFIERKFIEGKKINVLPKKTAIVSEKVEEKVPEAPKETAASEPEAEKPTEEVVEEKV